LFRGDNLLTLVADPPEAEAPGITLRWLTLRPVP
jgi:hypothetical protein